MMRKYEMHVFNCEAKIAAYAAEKLVAIDEVISAIPGFCKALCPVLFGDNQSVFKVVNQPGSLGEVSRYVQKDISVVRDLVLRLVIVYQWTSTKHMIADAGTKFYTQAVADVLIPRICGQLSALGKRSRSHDNA